MRHISKLLPRATNPRSHSLEQIEQIVASLKEFGWTIPLLIDENDGLLAGHGRWRAARLLGYGQAPCIVARGWSEAQKRAYVVLDNKLAENSEWDQKLLRAELKGLASMDVDMGLVGFSDDELSALIFEPQPTQGDAEEIMMKKCPACGRYSKKKPASE